MLRRSAQHFLYHNHKQTRLEQDYSLVEVLIIFSHQSRKEKLKGNVLCGPGFSPERTADSSASTA